MVQSLKQKLGGQGGDVPARPRADSVLGNRMDEMRDYTKLRSSVDKKWTKIRSLMAKKNTKLCLLELPRGVSTIASLH